MSQTYEVRSGEVRGTEQSGVRNEAANGESRGSSISEQRVERTNKHHVRRQLHRQGEETSAPCVTHVIPRIYVRPPVHEECHEVCVAVMSSEYESCLAVLTEQALG